MNDIHQPIELHLVSELLQCNRNKTSLKTHVVHDSHQLIKFHLISEFLRYDRNKSSLTSDVKNLLNLLHSILEFLRYT